MAQIEKRQGTRGTTYRVRIRRPGQPDLSRSFQTEAAAKKWARAIERDMDTNSFIPSDAAQNTTLRQVLERYRDEVLPRLARGAKPDQSRVARLIDAFGSCTLATLDSSRVAAYRDQRLIVEKASPQTVKHELGVLNRVLQQCIIDWGYHLPRGLATAQVRKPALPQGRERRLSTEEEKQLLEAARASRSKEIEPIIIIALETGARRGEIAAMRWEHIDLVKRTWHIPDTKTKTPRTVPLSMRAVAVLRALPRRLDGRVWALRREDGITQAFDRICKVRVKKEGGQVQVMRFFKSIPPPGFHHHSPRQGAVN